MNRDLTDLHHPPIRIRRTNVVVWPLLALAVALVVVTPLVVWLLLGVEW